MDDDFQRKTDAFIDWFKALPLASLNPKIALHDFRSRDAGRGVIALEDIEEDEVLFSIPRSSILTALNSPLASLASDFPSDPWLGLTLVLIYEHLQGAASRWKPYLDVLPAANDFNTLMFWSPTELDALQASAVRNKIGRAAADETFRTMVLPFIERHAHVFYAQTGTSRLSDDEMLALAHRMGSTIMAYAFDLEPSDETRALDDEGFVSDDEDEALPKGMLPLADMLNADADSNARLINGNEVLSMIALRPIRKGDEVLNDYGSLPRSDLLRRYGYITPKYQRFDVVEIPHELVMKHVGQYTAQNGITDEDLVRRTEYLEEVDVLDQGYDIERGNMDAADAAGRVHIPDELLHLMKILLVRDTNFKKLHKVTDEQLVPLMETVGQVSEGILEERLAQYPTSADADRAALERPALQFRERMAIEVRLGEKTLLEDAIALARSWKAQPAAKEDQQGDGPAHKRQRTS